MPVNETTIFKGYAIVDQVIEAEYGSQTKQVHRFTVYRPDKTRLTQKMTMLEALAAVDAALSGTA